MNNIKKLFSLLCLCPLLAGAQKYVGGDISLLPTYEEHGVHYLDTHGTQVQLLPYLGREAGWNAMRVRLFVDPSKAPAAHRQEGVRQDLDYVTALARRIKAEGYALMLDFHYSDTWTDPGSTPHHRPGPAQTPWYWPTACTATPCAAWSISRPTAWLPTSFSRATR